MPGRDAPTPFVITDLVIDPPAARWRGLVSSRPRHAAAGLMRGQLGLPTDRPVIMTGHQAAFWHAGILAKYLACDAAARSLGASPAWVVADQDDPRAVTLVEYPARGAGGGLTRARWDAAAGAAPPGSGGSPDPLPEVPSVRAGLARVARAWAGHATEHDPARRVAAALADLMSPLLARAATVFATDLSRTDLFRSLTEAMVGDPASCIAAHNAAASAHPSARVRPLDARRAELPLWRLTADGRRRAVFADDLALIPPEELAPRALLLTGLLRLGACDLFIHGTGGGGDGTRDGYDRVTASWLRGWAEQSADAAAHLAPGLAPIATVTATVRLGATDGASEAAAAREAWALHRAWHDPGALGDGTGAEGKRAALDAIARAPRGSAERHRVFADMHAALVRFRAEHAADLEARADALRRARARLADARVLGDRGWPFVLLPDAALLELRDRIASAFASA